MILKGAIHVHSTYSYDGVESLRSLRNFLLEKGVTFCCVTEHTDKMSVEQAQMFVQECKILSGSQFVFIPGFEVPYKKAHILFIGTEVFLSQKADAEILKMWSRKSVLTILAHPVQNGFKLDPVMREVIDGIEIWNQQYEGNRVPRTRSAALLRALQDSNPLLLAFGGIDLHRKEHLGAPLFTLEVERVSSDAILHALTDGRYVFGTEKIEVSSTGLWKGSGSFAHMFLSLVSICAIVSRKYACQLFVFARSVSLSKNSL